MTLPSSPPLTLTQILTELGRASAGQSLSGAADERALSDVASGAISFSDFLGKSSFHPSARTDSFTAAFATTSHTFTSRSLGTSYSRRTMILIVTASYTSGASASSPVSSATVGGSACTALANHGSFNGSGTGSTVWIGAVKVSGTTGDVVLSFSDAATKSVFCTLWAVDNIGTLTAYGSDFASGDDSSNVDTVRLNIPANGVLVMGWAGLANSSSNVTFSGISNTSNGGSSYRFDGLDEQLSAATNKAVSWTKTSVIADVTFVCVSLATS